MGSTGKCKLCGNKRPLLIKSHIIPEFMYSGLFDKDHKLNLLSPAQYVNGNKKVIRPSSGEYEGGILCQKCDNDVIGQYETYARQALFGGMLPPEEAPVFQDIRTPNGIKTRCSNISYKKFKLFLLSILWRASISKRPFFKEVKLGPHEDRIRQMIFNGDPKAYDEYPVVFFTFLNDRSIPPDLVGQPGINRTEKGISYIFIIGGITYVFHVSNHSIPPMFLSYTLLPTNEMTLLHISKGKAWRLLQMYFGMNK